MGLHFYLILSRHSFRTFSHPGWTRRFVMDSTTLYGYVPTHWIAILLASSCLFTLCTMIPALLFRYRNIPLGIFIIAGLIFQLAGHTSMALSSFRPTNIPAWSTQRLAFTMGKLCARIAVCYVYYTGLCRIPDGFPKIYTRNGRPEDEFRSSMSLYICGLTVCGFLACFIVRGFEIGLVLKGSLIIREGPIMMFTCMSSACIVLTTVGLGASVLTVISRTRKNIPWFRLTWMTGYYVTLQIVPVFLLTQDIYDIARCFFSYRNEMAELACDMGMTKSILIMLGGQTYEIAYSWSQKRPRALEKIELQVKKILEIRKQAKQVNGNTN